MSESSDMIMCRFTDILDLLIEIEMAVKNNAKDLRWSPIGTTEPATLTSDTGKGEILAS